MMRWLATIRARGALICTVVLNALSAGATEDPLTAVEDPLTAVEATIAAQFSVDETSTKDLAAALASADSASYLLFDVREPAEFERSHVRGAQRLAPDTKRDAFEKAFGDKVKGKNLVFYCSVGYRSSVMADRVRESAMEAGALHTLMRKTKRASLSDIRRCPKRPSKTCAPRLHLKRRSP